MADFRAEQTDLSDRNENTKAAEDKKKEIEAHLASIKEDYSTILKAIGSGKPHAKLVNHRVETLPQEQIDLSGEIRSLEVIKAFNQRVSELSQTSRLANEATAPNCPTRVMAMILGRFSNPITVPPKSAPAPAG